MSAEFQDIENEIEAEKNERPRDIDTLYDLPYSEMSEEEIDLIVAYKAEKIANDITHIRNIQTIQNGMKEQIEYNRDIANKSIDRLNELTAHAINRFEDASNG